MTRRVLIVDPRATARGVAVRALEAEGYEVREAADVTHGLELASTFVPELVLSEAVDPVDAPAFARALRAISNLRDVPFVLVTSLPKDRAEPIRVAAEATDLLPKPFGPEALLAVVAHALQRRAPATEDPFAVVDEATLADRARRADAARGVLERFLQGVGVDLSGGALEAQPPEAVLALAEELGLAAIGGEVAFRGRLQHIALGEVLQMLQHQAQTGVLHVESEPEAGAARAVQICLREGRVDLALARHGASEFLLGRYLVAEDLVDARDLERLAGAPRAREGGRLGARLVRLGYITRDDLVRALERQTSELVYEALRWPRGRFAFFRFSTRPEAEEARLALPITTILMEGLRRVDEWRLIAEQVRSFDMVPELDQRAFTDEHRARLSPEERTVVAAIDGARDVRAIIAESRLGSFDVCKVLYQLLSARLVRA